MNLSMRRLLPAFLLACELAAFPATAQTVVTLSSQYNAPQYVAVDANKTVFVTDTTNSLSALGLANGAYATTPTPYDTNFATLYVSPNGVAVGPDGHILSVSMTSSTPGFFFLFEFGPPNYAEIVDGSLPVSGGTVQGVAADSQGNFFVADTNGTVIKIFSPDYQAATSFATGQSGTDHPFGIAFDKNDNIFVADQQSGSGQILEYATAGGIVLLNTITSGNLQQPTGVAVDTRGNLYVADSAANTLTAFAAPDYTNAQVLVSAGLSGPMGVAVDADDNIFVVDTGHNALKEVLALPAVTALTAPAGPLGGGNSVTITGVHLTGASAVSFGGTAASGFTAVSDTEVTATAPAGSAGTVDIRVTTPNGMSIAVPADRYTYAAAPAVSSVSAASGPTAGGNVVSITGTNFVRASAVSFGGTPSGSFSVLGNTLISAVAPPGAAGTVDVTVTTPGGTSATGAADRYTYVPAPSVTAISPPGGPTAGGNSVTITGANLTGGASVSFGATPATDVVVASATQITATAPAGAAGLVDVTVTTPNGTSATSAADGYGYVAAPAITGVSPAAGPTGGGSTVTVTGTNFTGVSAVKFGTAAASGFTLVSATQITAISPAAAAGPVDVTVTTLGGTSAAGAADVFTYAALPTVTAISPVSGPPAGGTPVTITGTNLTGAASVKFGAASAVFTVNSGTQITATAPPGAAGAVDVTVTTPIGSSATGPGDQFTYGTGPTVSMLAPSSGPTAGGTVVTITGANLAGATAVTFGAVPAASFTITGATAITAVTPAEAAGSVDVTVTTPVGTSATNAGDRFRFGALPTVRSVSPPGGPTSGGNTVSIAGANLAGATAVKFGAAAATNVVVVSATQVTAIAPANSAGTVDVTVTTPIGTSATNASDGYTYTAVPSVTAISPVHGPISGGTSVTITGINLAGATAVKFGAQAAGFTVDGGTQITATAPPGAAGTVDVTVTTADGTSTANAADRFTYTALPIVTALSPASGGTAGGTSVTIAGANFTGATAVAFGATPAAFTVVSATQITATAPPGPVGTADVSVTTPNGTSAVGAADRFTYTTGTGGQVYSYLSTLGVPGVAMADNGHFSNPVVGAIDGGNGHLFVADTGNHRVQVLDTGSLAVVATIGVAGVAGSDTAHLHGPQGVGFDPATGHILVADTGNHRIQIFDSGSFGYVATLGVAGAAGSDNGHLNAPANVRLNPAARELYIADTGNDRVQVFDADTLGYIATIGVSGVAGADTAHLNQPNDAALDPSANQIMVADSGNGRLQMFDAATLAYAGTLGGPAPAKADNDYLGMPATAAFDPATNLVLVADAGTDDRVEVFDAMTYAYVLTLGTTGQSGAGNGQFAGPSGVAADPAHARLFIGDRQNDRVQVFQIATPVSFAAVLPAARSVQLGTPATLFASMVNAGIAPLQGCRVGLSVTAPQGLSLSYQTTNPATNALTGTPDTPATIAGGNGVQSFLVSFQGTDAFSAAALPLDFACAGVAPAAVETGVDTVDLTFSAAPIADIIALAATPTNDGIVDIPAGAAGAFAVATTNVGAASLIIASVDTGAATLPLKASICQSDPVTGQCLMAPAALVPLNIAAGAAPTFSVFLQATGPIALDPANARIFVRFRDAAGALHGATSVAVAAG
jgi:DNA-binding beta-propeller fold protein YncE